MKNLHTQEKKHTRSKKVTDALRKHYGLSVGGFAEMLGVSGSTVSSWSARDSLDEDLVFRVCKGVNYDWLKTGDGEMMQENNKQAEEVFQGMAKSADRAHEKISLYADEIDQLIRICDNHPMIKLLIPGMAELPEDLQLDAFKTINDMIYTFKKNKKGE